MDDSQSLPLLNSEYRDTSAEPSEKARDKRAGLTMFENLRDRQCGEQNVPSSSTISQQPDEIVLGERLGNCRSVHA